MNPKHQKFIIMILTTILLITATTLSTFQSFSAGAAPFIATIYSNSCNSSSLLATFDSHSGLAATGELGPGYFYNAMSDNWGTAIIKINCQYYKNIQLNYDLGGGYFADRSGDLFEVGYSIDNGLSWTIRTDFPGNKEPPSYDDTMASYTDNLSPTCDYQPNVLVRFRIYDSSSVPTAALDSRFANISIKGVESLINTSAIHVKQDSDLVKISDWKKSCFAPVYQSAPYTINLLTSTTPFKIPPKIDHQGNLLFQFDNTFTGTATCNVSVINSSTNSPEASDSFDIVCEPLSPSALLSPSEYDLQLATIVQNLNQELANTTPSSTNISSYIYDYTTLLDKCPDRETISSSLAQIVTPLTSAAAIIANTEVKTALGNAASKAISNACQIVIPGYNTNGKTKANVSDTFTPPNDSTASSFISFRDNIRTILYNHGIVIPLESIYCLYVKDYWNTSSSAISIPATLINDAFLKGIDNFSLKTDIAAVCSKKGTFPTSNEIFTFSANKLTPNTFDINLIKNAQPLTSLSRPVSIQIPYSYTDKADSKLLTVLKKIAPLPDVNIGGMFNYKFQRMMFFTNHFSMYMITKKDSCYSDVPATLWAYDYIKAMTAKSIISGNGTGAFSPSSNIRREDFATMIANTFGLVNSDATSNFADVPPTNLYYKAISSLYSCNIIMGTGLNFGIGTEITRQDAAVIIAQTLFLTKNNLKYSGAPDEYLSNFNDKATISPYAKEAICFIIASGIMNGKSADTFAPLDKMTRAEAAVILYKALNLQNSQSFPIKALRQDFIDVT